MKAIFGLIVLTASFSALSAPVKTCTTTLSMPEADPIPTSITIEQRNGKLESTMVQTIEGESVSLKESAVLISEPVRAGLTKDTDVDNLNRAESVIVHAMMLESDPIFQGAFKSGVALKKVRSAKLYVIGETTNMGNMSIVEAKDEKGKDLGSFVGGFLVAPCK